MVWEKFATNQKESDMEERMEEETTLLLKMRLAGTSREAAIAETESWLQKMSSLVWYEQDSLTALPAYNPGYEDPIAEVEVTVRSRKQIDARTLTSQLLHKYYAAAGKGMEKQMLMQIIQPPEAFYLQCKPVHLHCRLVAFQLGNFINMGTFYSHYEKHQQTCNPQELMDIRSKSQSADSRTFGGNRRNLTAPLYADFEHDRNVLKLRFAAQCRSNGKDQGVEWYAVTLLVRYESIRRIIVDPNVQVSATERGKRLYLFINFAPDVRRLSKNNKRTETDGNRWVFWHDHVQDDRNTAPSAVALRECPVLSLEFPADQENVFDEIVGRLKTRTHLTIEFGSVFQKEVPLKNYIPTPNVDPACKAKLDQLDSYKIKYLIEALLSRGAVVKDQLLLQTKDRDEFVDFVCVLGRESEKLTVTALERLLNCVDEKQNLSLLQALYDIYLALRAEGNRASEMLVEEQLKEGYMRVRKVIVTPTRRLLLAPELLMGNRILREFDPNGDYALRVLFRDDNASKMRKYATGEHIIRETITSTMRNGLMIAGRKYLYLGSSNSQMRDNGCYFFANDSAHSVHAIRKWMGEFDSENIPKMMSRMGLCFTQARKCDVPIERDDYRVEKDVIGGSDPTMNHYEFSDGVGRISVELARKIAVDFRFGDHTPSCYQFRFRGYKGVLSVDPALDDWKKWVNRMALEAPNVVVKPKPTNIVFRKSQQKFKAPKMSSKTTLSLEIVKHCSPTPLNLNRPLISILDQVSGMQGYESHRRVTERIHQLLGKHLDELAQMLIDEGKCAETLADRLPYRFDVQALKAKGFSLTVEPFFRLLTRAITRFSIKRQLAKEQIKVPSSLGRTMFGIMDETSQLQYGQVFVQYTHNLEAEPGPRTKKTILKGKVMVTKNPCVVPGDVRLFDAIDIPELRQLTDVIVFPRHGPRPHPDEMAGSDLDGDEYSVIWDPDLMFDHNEQAMDYIPIKNRGEKIDEKEVDNKMIAFFLDYVLQDSIGSISNAHLVNSDLYGIKSAICKCIAQKCYQAVDFPKTGYVPEPLTYDWADGLPPEKPERYPDFMGKDHEPCYISPRLVGQLYRRIKAVDDVFELTEKPVAQMKVEVDVDLVVDGWEQFAEEARVERDKYSANIRALMETYGIMDEGQLISGSITTVRNRVSDREHEDFSFYTTDRLIEARCTAIYKQARDEFFAEFGGVEMNTRANDRDERKRVCVAPSPDMQRKASAWYIVTYQERTATGLLSFPWVAWDVLASIKQRRHELSVDPIADNLSKYLNKFCNDENRVLQMDERLQQLFQVEALLRYHRKYPGLDKLFFVLSTWGDREQLFKENMKSVHLCLLLVQFGLGHLHWSFRDNRGHFLPEQVDEILPEWGAESQQLSLEKRMGGLGRILTQFLQYLASRDFSTSKMLNFMEPGLGYYSFCLRGEWLSLHRTAVKAFHHLVMTGRFDSLGLSSDKMAGSWDILEANPFMIELPREDEMYCRRYSLIDIEECIKEKTGVHDIFLRRQERYQGTRVSVSARGTLESLHRLRELVTVVPGLGNLYGDESGGVLKLKEHSIRHLVLAKVME